MSTVSDKVKKSSLVLVNRFYGCCVSDYLITAAVGYLYPKTEISGTRNQSSKAELCTHLDSKLLIHLN